MEDQEIYQLAENVLSSITWDLNENLYSKIDGTLSLKWRTSPRVNAWAQSLNPINEPPNHEIGIHYELARQLYRDIDKFCDYLESGIDKKAFDFVFQDLEQPIEMLPSLFSSGAHRKNMFIAAITWVFFHELGHLNQEHSYIRNQFLNSEQTLINECQIANTTMIEGKAAAICHVTEMAADFEATNFCILELIRQFSGDELKASIYLFVCGVSTALYKFHVDQPLDLKSTPIGTHPNPLIRLENILPQVYEFFNIPELHKQIGIELSHEVTAGMCNQAATAAGIFWQRQNIDQPVIPDNYFLVGNLNRTNGKAYLGKIITAWDEIQPSIKRSRRFDSHFGLLEFSQYTRDNILAEEVIS